MSVTLNEINHIFQQLPKWIVQGRDGITSTSLRNLREQKVQNSENEDDKKNEDILIGVSK